MHSVTVFESLGVAQVAKSIQLAMGLHDEDVAFFLAADEPATYLQVQISGAPKVSFTFCRGYTEQHPG